MVLMATGVKPGIALIFGEYPDRYKQSHKLSPYTEKIISDIIACRTAKLGGHVEVCERCGRTRIFYNSCRNRHCPKCQFIKKEKWILEKNQDVLPVEYFHIVFTVPEKLNLLMYRNSKQLYSLLLKFAGKTITGLAKEVKWLNGKTGAISVLHTWGQKLELHPHVHCIVPGGGLSMDKTKWIACKKGFFLPVKVMSKRFRRLFLDGLKQLYKNSSLYLEGSLGKWKDSQSFQALIDELYKTGWVVYSKKPFSTVMTVIKYLARYTHRIAISNYRIVKLENDYVHFTYRDYSDHNRKKVMHLHALEFMRRFLLHILPIRFVKVRYVGLLSNRTREQNIDLCRVILKIKAEDIPVKKQYNDFAEFLLDMFGFDVKQCPVCKGRLVKRADLPIQNYIRAP
jgi:hypothetical protein